MAIDRQPRWKKWRLMPEVDIWQAVALSLNLEPEKVQTSDHAWMGDRFPFDEGEEFDDRLNILLANASNRSHFPTPCRLNMGGGYLCGIRLSEFAEWAISVAEWDNLPPELVAMAIKPQAVPPTAQRVESAADTTPRPHKKGEKWSDDELKALLAAHEEGETQETLAERHGLERQRISTLLQQAREKFKPTRKTDLKTNPLGTLVSFGNKK